MILQLPANTGGTDFVVGDLHGCRHLLEARLAELGFCAETDRVLSVGDLVDRGPDSWGTLQLIEEPWFYFVLGNHEEMLLDLLDATEGQVRLRTEDPELAWVNGLTKAQHIQLRSRWAPRLLAAPRALKVGQGQDRFYVVHADRSRLRYTRPAELLDDVEIEQIALGDDGQQAALLWSRRVIREWPRGTEQESEPFRVAAPALAPGVSLTFVGHTVVEAPVLYRSHLYLDTGAYVTGRLTVLPVRETLAVIGASHDGTSCG